MDELDTREGVPDIDSLLSQLSEEEIRALYGEFEGQSVVKQCVYGVTESLFSQLFTLCFAVFIGRIVRILGLPPLLKHVSVLLLGVFVIINSVKEERLLATIIIITGSLLLLSRLVEGRLRGATVTTVGIATILAIELSFDDSTVIRGLLMVLVMKISSFSFDFPSSQPALLPTVAYLLDPATVVFGPFVSYSEYVASTNRRSIYGEALSWIGGSCWLLVAAGCAVYSSCQSEMVPATELTADYLTAQSFRFSHYFVCLFSQGLWHISGGSGPVTNPLPIELPRSLVDVVVAWNIPMHRYLRKYVFAQARSLGPAFAIFATFATSSLLHGLNAQLSGVLFSLGLLCYGENALRDKISSRLSVCARARPCRDSCEHKRKKNSPLTLLLNLCFSLLSIYHLIYLGMPFDGRSSASHTFSVWRRHHFASHCIAVGYLILARVL